MKMKMTEFKTSYVIYDRPNGLFLQALAIDGRPLWCREYPNAWLFTAWGAKRTLTKLSAGIEVIENYGFENERIVAAI